MDELCNQFIQQIEADGIARRELLRKVKIIDGNLRRMNPKDFIENDSYWKQFDIKEIKNG